MRAVHRRGRHVAVKSTGYHPVFGQVADEADDGPAVLSVSEVPPSDAQGDVVVGVKSKSDNGDDDDDDDDDDEMPERYPGHVLYKVTRYLVNGGFDFKYETDDARPPPAEVMRAVPRKDLRKLVSQLNDVLHKNRTKTGDIVALFTLMLLYVPLFTVRRKKRAKRRRKGIAGVIDSFNASHTGVVVRVDRVSGDLLICEALVDPPPHSRSAQEAWVSQ